MTTKTALIIVGVAAAAMAVYYAFGQHKSAVANDDGMKAASPPPQPVGRTLLTTPMRSLGAFAPGGLNYFR